MKYALLLGVLFLSGCATTPTHTVAPTWQSRLDWLSGCAEWTASGKLGVRVNDQGGSLTFRWHQKGEHFDVSLAGPLGQGQTDITGDPGSVTLRNGQVGELHAENAEGLLESQLGIAAPVSALPFWLTARPHGKQAKLEFAEDGRLASIDEEGWVSHFDSWQAVMGNELPEKMTITSPGSRLRFVIHQWDIAPMMCQK